MSPNGENAILEISILLQSSSLLLHHHHLPHRDNSGLKEKNVEETMMREKM